MKRGRRQLRCYLNPSEEEDRDIPKGICAIGAEAPSPQLLLFLHLHLLWTCGAGARPHLPLIFCSNGRLELIHESTMSFWIGTCQ